MPLRIGILGGIPPALGGHGLELQIERTIAALAGLGHEPVRVATAAAGAAWDVLHAFGSEGDVQHQLGHWTRGRAPLVITPVVVTSPGRSEALLLAASRWPAPATHASLRRRTLRQADVLVAGTAYERRVLRRLAGRSVRVEIVPNGADRLALGDAEPLPERYAVLLGTVSERKGQVEVVEALAGTLPLVVVGGHAGSPAHLARWTAAVERAGVVWLGHVADPTRVARIVSDAVALVHLSGAEVQSLAVQEALAAPTPVVLSDIPSHRELAEAYPEWVHVVGGADEPRPC